MHSEILYRAGAREGLREASTVFDTKVAMNKRRLEVCINHADGAFRACRQYLGSARGYRARGRFAFQTGKQHELGCALRIYREDARHQFKLLAIPQRFQVTSIAGAPCTDTRYISDFSLNGIAPTDLRNVVRRLSLWPRNLAL